MKVVEQQTSFRLVVTRLRRVEFIRNIKTDDVSPLPPHDNVDKTLWTPSSSISISVLSFQPLLPAHLCSYCSLLPEAIVNWLIRRVLWFVDELYCSCVCGSSEELQTSARSWCYFSFNCIFWAPLYSVTEHNAVALPREKCDTKLAISFGCSGIPSPPLISSELADVQIENSAWRSSFQLIYIGSGAERRG